jgi:hypothetical protein
MLEKHGLCRGGSGRVAGSRSEPEPILSDADAALLNEDATVDGECASGGSGAAAHIMDRLVELRRSRAGKMKSSP